MNIQGDNTKSNTAEAFGQMYISNYHKIRSFCFGYIKDENIAKCIAQDVFVVVWNNRNNLSFSDELLPYLFVLAKNMCLNILKREKVKQSYKDYKTRISRESLNYSSLKEVSINSLYGKEVEDLIKKAIEQMPDTVKSTFCLSRFRDMKYGDIAKCQDISVKTVEYRIMCALRILRRALRDYLPVLLGYFSTRLFY
ncbi:MAG: RNA polymerase sigma-70 factor [Bacteroidales bacterium]|nr:RNA polymerase sigma-70 factor [Bacteroidales bacterium]